MTNDQTRRPTKGDRVRITDPDDKLHGLVGTIEIDDESGLPYLVEFESGGSEWFDRGQVALAEPHDAGRRMFAPGGVVPAARPRVGDRVTVQRYGRPYNGRTGEVVEVVDLDNSDVPYRVRLDADRGGKPTFIWCGEHQIVLDTTRPEEGETPAPEREIAVERKWTIRLDLPVTAHDLARAAAMLPPGLHVAAHRVDRCMEITATEVENG